MTRPFRSCLRGVVASAVAFLFTTNVRSQVSDIHISDVRPVYSSPYLLDFNFHLRDQNDHALWIDPAQFHVTCREAGVTNNNKPILPGFPISESETGFRLMLANRKQLKGFLVLDYTRSMTDPFLNPDDNLNDR
jgi:hypothetical protein